MASPRAYLPTSISETDIHSLVDSLAMPRPTSITLLSTSGEYHRIYILSYPTSTLSQLLPDPPRNSSPTSLILRISGPHFPSIKTLNECAVLKWIGTHTTIPVPRVLHYDASRDNALGYEYMLMTRALGRSFDRVREELSASSPEYEEHLEGFVRQVAEIISELQSNRWRQIGGLREVPERKSSTTKELRQGRGTESIDIVEGPFVDENMWQVPELELFWDGKETFQSLNALGPFPSYVSFVTAQAEKYIYAIERHISLSFMRSLVPKIEAFMAAIEQHQEELNRSRLVLAHRDFHFGNVMYDVSSRQITAVLDWEFSGVVPAQRWDARRTFMWNGSMDDKEEKALLRERVAEECRERGVTFFEDVEYTGKRQEHMQLAMNFLRAIVEVMPRGEMEKPVNAWKESMLVNMDAFYAE